MSQALRLSGLRIISGSPYSFPRFKVFGHSVECRLCNAQLERQTLYAGNSPRLCRPMSMSVGDIR